MSVITIVPMVLCFLTWSAFLAALYVLVDEAKVVRGYETSQLLTQKMWPVTRELLALTIGVSIGFPMMTLCEVPATFSSIAWTEYLSSILSVLGGASMIALGATLIANTSLYHVWERAGEVSKMRRHLRSYSFRPIHWMDRTTLSLLNVVKSY